MKCLLNVIVLSSITVYFVRGSIVELNETTFASIPPLYGFDPWAQCQREGDVYCIVDADLVAPQPSELLQLLKDYSNQTLKHYNRTQIHRGVCVTRCGNDTSGAWSLAAESCLNDSVAQYGLQAQVTSVDHCASPADPGRSAGARGLLLLAAALAAAVLAATAAHVLCQRCAAFDGNKYLLAFSLKQNWAVLTYDRTKPRSDERMKDLACLEGIRFIGMQCVIFSHVLFVYLYSFTDNPQFIEKMYDTVFWQIVFNSPLWLQAFFAMSGLLTAYSVLVSSEKTPVTIVKCAMSVVNRWIRLTPLAAFALWFTASCLPLLGAGPAWGWLAAREARHCARRGAYHLLYAHNLLPLGELCMGHTWYLAVDMQLHVLGIFLLYVLVKCKRAVLPTLAALLLVSPIASAAVVYVHKLTPIITAQSPEALRTMFLGSKVMSALYLPTWCNFSGYFTGVAVAFILYHNQVDGVKLNQKKWFNILFHLSLTLGGLVVASGAVFLQDTQISLIWTAVYAALDRSLVAAAFGVFMLGCLSRCHSALRSLLEWKGFHMLGRLSYCAFLIHFIVLRLTLADDTRLAHASPLSLIGLLITASTLTYIISIPLVLTIELPALQLWKAMTERDRAPPALATPAPAHPTKLFDLVAHIRRRHDI